MALTLCYQILSAHLNSINEPLPIIRKNADRTFCHLESLMRHKIGLSKPTHNTILHHCEDMDQFELKLYCQLENR